MYPKPTAYHLQRHIETVYVTFPLPHYPTASALSPTTIQMLPVSRRLTIPLLAQIRFTSSNPSSQSRTIRPIISKERPRMNSTQAVLDWITAHPYQTAFHVVNGVIICTPAAATVPFLAALGFTAAGPAAGSSIAFIPREPRTLTSSQAQQRLESCRTSQQSLPEVSMQHCRAQPWAATEPALWRGSLRREQLCRRLELGLWAGMLPADEREPTRTAVQGQTESLMRCQSASHESDRHLRWVELATRPMKTMPRLNRAFTLTRRVLHVEVKHIS